MIKCQLCDSSFKNINGLSKHIHAKHDITRKCYYDQFVGLVSPICICGAEKKFRDLDEGYRKFCSPKCRSAHVENAKPWAGKKQPQEMIEKRRETQLKKYGVGCGFLVNHSKAEKYKNFTCRSTYEKLFVDFAEQFRYTLTVPKRIQIQHEGKIRYYYPDFYLKELDLIVEIKSNWTWHQHLDLNISKLTSCLNEGYRIVVIDEEDGLIDKNKWEELNEYLCLI
jgi:hypothetical protein